MSKTSAPSTKTWYSCTKCGVVSYYYIHDDLTTSFPVSELAHLSDVVAGLPSQRKALLDLKKRQAKRAKL